MAGLKFLGNMRRQSEKAIAPQRMTRAFEAGKIGRRLTAIPTSGQAINSQIRRYGRNIVARSRYLAANNPYASAAKEAFVSSLVGCGIKPSSLATDADVKKEIAQKFLAWTDEADADFLTDFYGMQAIAASEMFEAGECFARIRPRFASDGLTVPMQIQLLPSEMLPTDHNEVLANGRRIECGIQFDPIGRREGYWFYKQHPGENFNANLIGGSGSSLDKTFVPADQVLHLYRPVRAGQIRGLPHTLSGIVTLALIDLYDDAELERKRTAALFSAFVTRPAPEDDDGDSPFKGSDVPNEKGENDIGMEPGATVELQYGQDIKFAEPSDVGTNYEAFQYRNLLRAATGFGATYSDMTGDLRQTSYGSIRAGLVAYRRRIEAIQHHVMVYQFCRPIWKAWFASAVLSGALSSVPAKAYVATPLDFNSVKWIPPKWEWIDPLKDRQAEKLAVDSGFKSRGDVVEAEGYDPEEVDQRIKQDQERASRLGLKFIQLPSQVIVASSDDEESLVDDAGSPANNPLDE